MAKIGIIAGSGFYDIDGVKVREVRRLATPFGEPSDDYRLCEFSGLEFAFLARHGTPHHIPPHMINYRANIWGFRELGVERIVSVNAVGGIAGELRPGDLVVPDQIIDTTQGRASTFYDKDEVIHVDFTMPYCTELRETVIDAGRRRGIALKGSGTYICVNGPRLESKAEIDYFSKIGADFVGMTVMPEAGLARELALCFAVVAVVTNYAAGISEKKLTTTEVIETMRISMGRIRDLLFETLRNVPEKRSCGCKDSLKEAGM